ncbi:MAG TPA: hypothetical protein VEO02_08545 [Thermoanaerobaculia bacterium]|nr:hypothetical protein [Thermoanaerobaculia bacterium]
MNPDQRRFSRIPAALARIAALAVVAFFAVPGIFTGADRNRDDRLVFRNVRSQTEQFIDYDSAIRLTPTQERIKAEALDSIPAPCCKKFSMKTCCCPCNLAKSAWGLSNYLIAKKGYGAPEVRSAVVGWLAFTNQKGFTGDACFTGGCKRPFAENGCAGMDATHVILGDDVQ